MPAKSKDCSCNNNIDFVQPTFSCCYQLSHPSLMMETKYKIQNVENQTIRIGNREQNDHGDVQDDALEE